MCEMGISRSPLKKSRCLMRIGLVFAVEVLATMVRGQDGELSKWKIWKSDTGSVMD